jgi:predicted PhzF superfamily epimerase YddE/YHI9
MSEPIIIKGTVRAWLTSTSDRLDRLLEQIKTDPADAVTQLGYSAHDMDNGSYPWAHIGTAEITVTLHSKDAIVSAQIKTLNGELQKERAESQRRQNAILDRISKLSALEYVEAAE